MTRFKRYHHDPDGTRLPIKLDATTNGEFAPIPLTPVHHRAPRQREPPSVLRRGFERELARAMMHRH